MTEPTEFRHESPNTRPGWVLWLAVAIDFALFVFLFNVTSEAARSDQLGPTAKSVLYVTAGVVQLVAVALTVALWFNTRFHTGTYRVVLTSDRLRAERVSMIRKQLPPRVAFDEPLDRIDRLVIDRYPLDGDQVSYSIRLIDGITLPLELPAGDPDTVWPPLFEAIRRLRPQVETDHRTHP